MESNIIIEAIKYLGEDVLLQKVSPVFFMYEYEVGVLMRNGMYVKDLKPGINYKFPFIDRFHTVVSSVETVEVLPIQFTTHNGIQATVEPILKYIIIDPKKYIVDTNDACSNLKQLARGIIANYLTDIDWSEVKEKRTLTAIKNALKSECAEMGVQVEKVYFGQIVTTKVYTVLRG